MTGPLAFARMVAAGEVPGDLTDEQRQHAIAGAVHYVLRLLGEDPHRDGLRGTPERVARWWWEFLHHDAGNTDTTFEHVTTDQMVVVRGLHVWSLCEHHMLPFGCDISVGYIADGRVLGLSKFARLAHKVAHRLQVQERLVEELAQEIRDRVGVPDVAVVAAGEHLCMTMRGVRTRGTMVSSSMHGSFRDSVATREEFLRLSNALP